MSRTAVLLVGHGSHHGAESARPVHLVARRLRAEAAFAEVRVGFWKEDPHLHHAMDLIESSEVTVVPMFTSTGHFTERVVPRELALSGPLTHVAGRKIRYCRPVGAHPAMEEIVLERARDVAALSPSDEAAATLVLVGHGTDAHARSGDTTHLLADRLRKRHRYSRVLVAFLDQEPHVEAVVAAQHGNVIVVPFFMSKGWHVGTTLPGALALDGGRTERGSTTLWYAQPVGTHPRVVEVVREIVADEGIGAEGGRDQLADETAEEARVASPESPAPVAETPVHATPTDVVEAKRDFLQWISEGGRDGRVFLQTVTLGGEDGRFEMRHVIDRDRDASDLREYRDVEDALEVAGLSTGSAHRPLRTTPDLAGGWRFTDLTPDGVWEVFAHLYPAAPVHRYLARVGRLRVEPSALTAPKPAWEGAERAKEKVGHALDGPTGRA